MSLIEKLQKRAAIKSFDATKKLTKAQLDQLLDSVRLAPSSMGLQAYRILVVEDPEIREKLREAAHGQAQLTQSSQVIIFAIEKEIDKDYGNYYLDLIAKTRGIGREHLAGFEQMVQGTIASLTEEQKINWSTKQAYIALGVLLTAAAEMDIDACPMEGFDAGKFDEILGLKALGLSAVVIAPVGYRSDEDVYSKMEKVRRPKEDLFIHI
ncbi:NAD(P)H-dependent oxidoreductase [Mucilaginibacter sp. E4BP6]|uniref:NAD(P)H-dependent oxidoreductase n=1 Tax=Mucilaginibacter sp. E4BP6 TaxID=2723089 RepID=UPI0015C9C159|nr:NAD(P)H-dependent oxidoreductase [Mucilaginibacter sp. E4BP6]NYE67446.1 nitroreductase [Mucilaginibacter sp. E4BP6]